jgi:protein CpxP
MNKKLIIGMTAAAISLGGLGTAWAHFREDGGRGGRMLDHMAEELDLTAEQKAQIAETMKSRHAARKEGREDRREFFQKLTGLKPDAPDYQQQLDDLVRQAEQRARDMVLERAEQQQKIYAILTPEQRTEFAGLKQDMRKRWQDRAGEQGKTRRGKHCD